MLILIRIKSIKLIHPIEKHVAKQQLKTAAKQKIVPKIKYVERLA